MSGQSTYKNPRKVFSQVGGGGTDAALTARVSYLEDNTFKITYYAEINTASGTITKPTGSTIITDQFASGADAYVTTIVNGRPSTSFPQTAGGVSVDVATFDASGNYTLTGTPSAFPCALIYILTIKAVNYQNLTTANILDLEDINAVTRVPSTDNAATRFNGVGGEVQNSNLIINDDGSVLFNGVSGSTYTLGKLVFDTDNDCLTFYNSDSNVALNIGQENWIRVRNVSGSTISNGAPVYVTGVNSGLPTIGLAKADAEATSVSIGLATESITNNSNGFVTTLGLVRNFDTSAFVSGAIVYVSSATAGVLTSTIPSAPNYRYRVGIVITSNATTGSVLVLPGVLRLGNGAGSSIMQMNAAGTSPVYNSFLEVAEQSAPSSPTNALRLFADSSNRFSWKGENGFVRTFDGTANTADRMYTLPDSSGTIALTSVTDTKYTSYFFTNTVLSPADGVSYYYGGHVSLSTVANSGNASQRQFKFGADGTLIIGKVNIVQTTNGSGETVTVNLRNVTDGTSSLLFTFASNFGANTTADFIGSGLNISVLTTKYYAVEIVCPTFATNPQWYASFNLLVRH